MLISLVAAVALLSSCQPSYEERVAEPLTIKVAIVYEDPVVTEDGKRLHEVSRVGKWAYWNDPFEQAKVFEQELEKASHGVVNYEVVMEVETDHFYTYKPGKNGEREWITNKDIQGYCKTVDVPGFGWKGWGYDYLAMLSDYGFDKMRDNDELHEVWVFTHPGSCMFESRLIGDGAFWCNSVGITKEMGATNDKLLTVMFCNYERTVDLALHSYGHRVESIMAKVYGLGGEWWKYDQYQSIDQLTAIQLFSAYQGTYAQFEEGYSQIGMTHFPPNSVGDYDYSNTQTKMTYADEWMNYPNMKFKPENARPVTNAEWKHEGGDQWGYMMWYFSHLPHFKGISKKDGKLNNWWHYIVDWNSAIELEAQLQKESGYKAL